MKKITLGLLIFLVLGLAIFLLYRSGFRENQVLLELEAPDEAAAGEEIEYLLLIENKNNFALEDVRLVFTYPEGAVPLDSEGEPSSSLINNLDLTELESHSKKEFILRAVLGGSKGEVKKAKANLSYAPSNLRSVFEKKAEAATIISRENLSLVFSGPPNILSGQTVQLSLDLRNETDQDFENLEANFSYPDGFLFKKSIPSFEQNSNFFRLSLKKGEGVRISIEGEVSGFEKEAKRFTAVLRKKFGDEFFDFQKVELVLTVSTPLLSTEVSIGDSKEHLAGLGEKLNYKIKFANNSNDYFSALELRVKLEGELFDFATLKSSGFFDQNSRTILWNAGADSSLSSLAPNQKGEISFEIGLKKDFPKTFGKNYSLKASSLIQTSSVPPDFGLDKISASGELITKVKSKTEFSSSAVYRDSVFSNSGPLLPQVGQKTTYTVHWKIINQGNDLSDIRVVSFILPGTSWENKFKLTPSQSEIRFDPSLGRITWLIPFVPAGTGVISPVFEAVFQVGITPSVNQAGQAIEILKERAFEAVDNFTKEKINLSQPGINTEVISN